MPASSNPPGQVSQRLPLIAISLALLSGFVPTAASAPAPTRVTVSVVGTNDLHGHLSALPLLGGYLTNLRKARGRDGGGVVLLDAGDMFQGTLESNLGEGAAVVRAYNGLGYTAAALGNHEFDFGPAGPAPAPRSERDDPRGALRARAAEARFPFLDTNLVDTTTGAPPNWPNVRPTALVEVAGVKVGIVGVTTIATPRTTLASNFAGLAVRPLAPAIAAAARELRRAGATVVLVAAHAGGACKTLDAPDDAVSCEPNSEIFQVARALPPGSVDAIVAGHTHEGVAHRVAGIPIIEAFADGRAFGRVDLVVDRRRGRVIETRIHPPHPLCAGAGCAPDSYEGATVVPDADVATAIAPALAAARAKRDERLAEATGPIPRAYRVESPLGNLFADLMRAARPDADVAITNGGGLRADLPAGAVTYGRLFEAIPFDNSFASISLTGAELSALIARNLGRDGGIISISGVRATARCAEGALEVTLARPDGQPVGPGEHLTVVTSNFLATGGDALFPTGRATIDEGHLIREAMADLLRARRTPLQPEAPALYDAAHPRLDYGGPRPVRCAAASRHAPK